MTRFLQPRYALPITSVLLALFLLVGVGSHVIALKTGKEISITARGYDPRALLLGHYVRLQPDLSGTLSTEASARVSEAFDMGAQDYRHEIAWLSLTRSEDGWTIEDVSKDLLQQSGGTSVSFKLARDAVVIKCLDLGK